LLHHFPSKVAEHQTQMAEFDIALANAPEGAMQPQEPEDDDDSEDEMS
jgi:hypothetical protein